MRADTDYLFKSTLTRCGARSNAVPGRSSSCDGRALHVLEQPCCRDRHDRWVRRV